MVTAKTSVASPTTSTSLSEGQDGASLGNSVILLQSLEVAIKIHDRVEVRELGAVNQDSRLDRVEGVVLDPFFKVVSLHVLSHIQDSKLNKSGQSIVLLHVSSTVLVEVVVLAVTTVEQGLEGRNDVTVHGADPVTPEEEGVQGTPDLLAILRG